MRPYFTFKEPFSLAFSGGKDSLAVLHWVCSKSEYRRHLDLVFHVNHGLPGDDEIAERAYETARHFDVPYKTFSVSSLPPAGVSVEAWCREKRYEVFSQFAKVLTCHHLGDAVEQYFMNWLKGCPEHLPISPRYDNIIRPFITTRPKAIQTYLERNNLQSLVVEDWLNEDLGKVRSWTRQKVLPLIEERFGMEKVVLKKFYIYHSPVNKK